MSFEQWMAEVNQAVMAMAGVSVHDLADYCFRDSYDAGEEPAEVAEEILEREGF